MYAHEQRVNDTRQRILERAAPLLNRQGYQSAPVSEIMRVTGLQKGGLYNHFESKEELALAAFDLLMERVNHKVLAGPSQPQLSARAIAGAYRADLFGRNADRRRLPYSK